MGAAVKQAPVYEEYGTGEELAHSDSGDMSSEKWLWSNMNPSEVAEDFGNRVSEVFDRSKRISQDDHWSRVKRISKERYGFDISI
jgi:hypothetical protein